jgi:hypothetical protein
VVSIAGVANLGRIPRSVAHVKEALGFERLDVSDPVEHRCSNLQEIRTSALRAVVGEALDGRTPPCRKLLWPEVTYLVGIHDAPAQVT